MATTNWATIYWLKDVLNRALPQGSGRLLCNYDPASIAEPKLLLHGSVKQIGPRGHAMAEVRKDFWFEFQFRPANAADSGPWDVRMRESIGGELTIEGEHGGGRFACEMSVSIIDLANFQNVHKNTISVTQSLLTGAGTVPLFGQETEVRSLPNSEYRMYCSIDAKAEVYTRNRPGAHSSLTIELRNPVGSLVPEVEPL